MLLMSRTPLRISLGGGGTDLPSYCSIYGGFIFGFALDMHLDIFIRRPWIGISDRIELQYLRVESVDSVDDVQHTIGREALRLTGVTKSISLYFRSDAPAGTGLGSSGSCAVGLLNGLWRSRDIVFEQADLAEQAFRITQTLGLPDGKQDPYLAALGGFVVLEIGEDQTVRWYHPAISDAITREFLSGVSFFYSDVKRDSVDVLRDQDNKKALKLKHRTKIIGQQILQAFELGNLQDFGLLMDEHWRLKREMSVRISSPKFDHIYETALANGAIGGKLIGAGGGGYFLFYSADVGEKNRLLAAMLSQFGFGEVPLGIDYKGSRVADINI